MGDPKKKSQVDQIIDKINSGPSQIPDAGGVRYDAEGNRIGYVGVANDYKATRRPDPMSGIRRPDSIDPASEQVDPYYVSGYDEDTINNMSTDDVARLQIDMVKAGLLTKSTTIRFGKADESTGSAYKKLITYANQNGLTQTEAMTELQSNPEVKIGVDAQGNPYINSGTAADGPTKTITDPVFTDPLAARATLRDTLQQRLGRDPSADEYHQFRNMLSNAEAGQDVETRTPGVDKKGNAVTRVTHSDNTTDPTAGELADDYSRKGALGREANTRMAGVDYYDALQQLIGGN